MNVVIHNVKSNPGDSAFLIVSENAAVLCDTGFAFTGEAVAENIKKCLGDKPLDLILLTHSHYDHALGAPYIKKHYPDCKVVAGEYAAKIFAKPTARAVMRDLDSKFAKTCGVCDYEDLIDELEADITVNDGDKIECKDMTFKVISLPGHTKCSVAYYLEEEKLLLSTETIGVYDGENTVVPSYLVGYEMTLESIEKAKALDIEKMLVPHMGVIDRARAQYYLSEAKRSAENTYNEIKELLQSGKSHDDAVEYFKNKFYHGRIVEAYPIDAMMLNTNIMVSLIEKSLLS